MMKNLVLLVGVFLTLSACSKDKIEESGKLIKVEKDYTDFKEIEVSNGFELFLTYGDEEKVEIEAYESIQPYVKSSQSGNSINFYKDNDVEFDGKPAVKIHVKIKDLNEVVASGGSRINSVNDLKLEDLKIQASGGSNVDLSGSCTDFTLNASGGTRFVDFNFVTNVFQCDVSGGGEITLSVSEKLFVKASGGTVINYKGEGVVESQNLSGGSQINKL